jgi:tetratricopeptide (TPR) repeat protein
VLQILDSGEEVQVRVIRGRADVDDDIAEGPRSVGPAEVAVLGRAGVRPTDEQENAAAWQGIDAFDLLDSGAGAIVDVRSVPAGARVTVDGAYLGRTPVAAAVRAGHRRLELALADREPVREFVDVLAGETLSRAFELQLAPELAEAPAVDGGTAGTELGAGSTDGAGAAEMLARAQSLRSERDWPGAARAYRELIRRHPGSDEARSSLVSLAQVELGKLGRPARALKLFDTYLARAQGGPLALEALLGRARALRALGRTAAERAALERFLDRYPEALQAAEVRGRLESLSASLEGSGSDSDKN